MISLRIRVMEDVRTHGMYLLSLDFVDVLLCITCDKKEKRK